MKIDVVYFRVVKQLLREMLRSKMEELRLPLEEPYLILIVNVLNLLFNQSKEAKLFWDSEIKPKLKEKFGISIPENVILQRLTFSAKTPTFNRMLLSRIQQVQGLKLSDKVLRAVNKPNSLVYSEDIIEIGDKIKHMVQIFHEFSVTVLEHHPSCVGIHLQTQKRR
jgi:hypothetical protein